MVGATQCVLESDPISTIVKKKRDRKNSPLSRLLEEMDEEVLIKINFISNQNYNNLVMKIFYFLEKGQLFKELIIFIYYLFLMFYI
jgi:hypothetical protein